MGDCHRAAFICRAVYARGSCVGSELLYNESQTFFFGLPFVFSRQKKRALSLAIRDEESQTQ